MHPAVFLIRLCIFNDFAFYMTGKWMEEDEDASGRHGIIKLLNSQYSQNRYTYYELGKV